LVGAISLTNEKRGFFVKQQHDQILRIPVVHASALY